jgi:hypothetical protein
MLPSETRPPAACTEPASCPATGTYAVGVVAAGDVSGVAAVAGQATFVFGCGPTFVAATAFGGMPTIGCCTLIPPADIVCSPQNQT